MARILIVDDSGISRMMAKMALAGERHELITANDGVEGLEKARLHYVCKPFDPAELLTKVRTFLPRTDQP